MKKILFVSFLALLIQNSFAGSFCLRNHADGPLTYTIVFVNQTVNVHHEGCARNIPVGGPQLVTVWFSYMLQACTAWPNLDNNPVMTVTGSKGHYHCHLEGG